MIKQKFKHFVKLRAIATIFCFASALPANGQCEVDQLASQGNFGRVSISGDVAVISDTDAFSLQGAAFVYRRGSAGQEDWKLDAVLMAPEPDIEDQFGYSVAVSGDVIVVSAHHSAAPEFQSGAVHIFRYNPGTTQWEHEAILTASDGDGSDIFGFSVAIDGNVVLIGARDDENDGISQSGSAYIFRHDPDTSEWIEEAKLTDPNAEEDDLFGVSVSIRGNVALVGAHGSNHVWSHSGSAFVFRREGLKWSLDAELADFDSPDVGWFGFSVSMSDGVAIIGAHQTQSTPKGNDAGAAYIYRFNPKTSVWIEEQYITASDAAPLDFYGRSVSISEDGNTVIVGSQNDDDLGSKSGSAYVYQYTQGFWKETAKLLASDGGSGDKFGKSVFISKDVGFIKGGGKGYIFVGMMGIDCNENGESDACDIFDGQSNDQNSNNIPDECDSDLDGSGSVGTNDLLILLSNWGPCDGCASDLDGNGIVGTSDLLILLSNWG